MTDEEDLIAEAQQSRKETDDLREESGLGGTHPDVSSGRPESPLPEKHDPQPWAKASSGDKEHLTDDEADA